MISRTRQSLVGELQLQPPWYLKTHQEWNEYCLIQADSDRPFKCRCINFVTDANASGAGRGRLDDANIKAYLIHPEKDCYGKADGYRKRWNKIKEEVGNTIQSPNPKTFPDRWAEPAYARKDRDDLKLLSTAAGHILFKNMTLITTEGRRPRFRLRLTQHYYIMISGRCSVSCRPEVDMLI